MTKSGFFRLLAMATMAVAGFGLSATPQTTLTSPTDHFGFEPGTARNMFGYSKMMDYFFLIEAQSDMIHLQEIGHSEMGKPMYVAFISSAANIERLDELREINRKLALDTELSAQERQDLTEKGRVFIFATLSMHATEVGPSQAAPLIAYNLISGSRPELHEYLNDVVYMMNPCHNPDGMDMIVDHYNKFLGTSLEGSGLPRVYHKYVGHNINRDFVTLSQSENQAIADVYNLEWHPQVLVEKHQMGTTGVRYFVPPNHDPIAQNIDENLWGWTWVFGSGLMRDMTARGLTGISQHYMFDDYWPGSTQTSSWKNVIGLLTEAASAQIGTPLYVEPNELSVGGKGISEYKKGINFLAPWPGGWWSLGDIVTYEMESTYSLIKTGSIHKKDILNFRNEIAVKEVERGRTEPPYYYAIPQKQHDSGELIQMLRLLQRHGITLYTITADRSIDGTLISAGDIVIPLDQPFRPFIKEVMEQQVYPVRRYTPGGDIIEPYDITSWSLPLHRGVKSHEINTYDPEIKRLLTALEPGYFVPQTAIPDGRYLIFNSGNNESYQVAFQALAKGIEVMRAQESFAVEQHSFLQGSFMIESTNRNRSALSAILENTFVPAYSLSEKPDVGFQKMTLPRILICETNLSDMDAGWTRFLFDTYGIPFSVLPPSGFAAANLTKDYDVIIFPDATKQAVMQGRFERGGQTFIPFYDPADIKGMGSEGWQKVLDFIELGGKVLSWGRSNDLFTGLMEPGQGKNAFNFPVNNAASAMEGRGLKIPGSFLKIQLQKNHPLSLGMPEETGVFQRSNPILSTSIPAFGMDRRVIGRFPENEILLSGYAEKIDALERQPALVWVSKGKGQLVLYSFVPNFRGSTPATYKLIFNALLL